jgi:hypothetical protein
MDVRGTCQGPLVSCAWYYDTILCCHERITWIFDFESPSLSMLAEYVFLLHSPFAFNRQDSGGEAE